MPRPKIRDISAERRAKATETVERHLRELDTFLRAEPLVAHRVVEGSAVAAEVFLMETNTQHTAMRVALFVPKRNMRALGLRLTNHGFMTTEPTGDAALLRAASRQGRRPIHVLFEGDGLHIAQTDGLHPNHPKSVRARTIRFGSAWFDLAVAYCRTRHRSLETHDETESFEVQVIER